MKKSTIDHKKIRIDELCMADQGGNPSNRSTTAKGLKVRKTKTKKPPEQTSAQGV